MSLAWFDHPFIDHWLERAARRRIESIVPLAVSGGDEAARATDVAAGDDAPALPSLDDEPPERLVAGPTALNADR